MTHRDGMVRSARHLGDEPGLQGNSRPEIRKGWSMVTWHIRGRGRTEIIIIPGATPLLISDMHTRLGNLLRSKHLYVAARCHPVLGLVHL